MHHRLVRAPGHRTRDAGNQGIGRGQEHQVAIPRHGVGIVRPAIRQRCGQRPGAGIRAAGGPHHRNAGRLQGQRQRPRQPARSDEACPQATGFGQHPCRRLHALHRLTGFARFVHACSSFLFRLAWAAPCRWRAARNPYNCRLARWRARSSHCLPNMSSASNPLSIPSLTAPVAMGYVPLGAVFGFLFVQAGGPGWLALASSLLIYAGAAQFMMVPMLAAGLPLSAIVLATLVLNLRHVFYGLSLLNTLPAGRLQRWYCIFALTDETYSVLTA